MGITRWKLKTYPNTNELYERWNKAMTTSKSTSHECDTLDENTGVSKAMTELKNHLSALYMYTAARRREFKVDKMR